MPPRHGKTEMVTVRLCVYILEHDPTAQILITGHNEKFARRLCRKARNLAIQYGIEIAKGVAAADAWETVQGGWVHARGVGTPPTGIGYQWIIIDDPIKNREQADSESIRDKMWDWYTDDLATRLEPVGKKILVLTRWHEDDVAARAIDAENFTILSLPAINEDGEALWPERWPLKALLRQRDLLFKEEGERSWLALYQQEPRPPDGIIFKTAWFKKIMHRPPLKRWVRGWDLASTVSKGSDYTVGVLMGIGDNDEIYVADVVRFKLEWPDAVHEIHRVSWDDQRYCDEHEAYYKVVMERSAFGSVAVQDLWKKHMFATGKIQKDEYHPTGGDKAFRARPWAARAQAMGIYLVDGPWNDDFIAECIAFDQAKHDDQVDASTAAFFNLRTGTYGNQSKEHKILYNSFEYWRLRIDGEIDKDDDNIVYFKEELNIGY